MFFRLICLAVFLFGSCLAIQNTWGPSVTIVSGFPVGGVSVLDLSNSSDGEIAVCLYNDSTANKFFSSHTTNHGQLWTAGVGVNATDGDVAIDSDGSKAIFSFILPGNNLFSYFSTDLGVSWLHTVAVFPNAIQPAAVLNSDGSKAYFAWVDTGTNTVHWALSQDDGQTWPFTGNLGAGKDPSIATSADGEIVYVAFTGLILNVAISFNHGGSWTSIPIIPNGGEPSITTTDDGSQVFVSFTLPGGVSVAYSSDFGAHWNIYPVMLNVSNSSIATSANGGVTPIIMREALPFTISSFFTIDHALSWMSINETSAETGLNPKIVITKSGGRAMRVWSNSLQNTVFSSFVNFSLPSGLILQGKQSKTNLLLQRDLVNEIFWNKIAAAAYYSIYADAGLQHILSQTVETSFFQHNIPEKERISYFITWTDSLGNESSAENITLP